MSESSPPTASKLRRPATDATRTRRSADELLGAPSKIDVRGVDFFYGANQALFGIDLVVPERCVTAFIGPSGCGKSTLLRCMNRMNDMIEGARRSSRRRSHLDGEEHLRAAKVDVVELRKRVGMVFQKSNPFPKSIFENVVLRPPRGRASANKARLFEIAERCLQHAALWDEVKDRLDDSALALSGGQQQRSLHRQGVGDRPARAADGRAGQRARPVVDFARIEDLIFELKEEYTIVIVTHNMQQAARVSDQTAFFFQGVLVEVGWHDRVVHQPDQETDRRLHHRPLRLAGDVADRVADCRRSLPRRPTAMTKHLDRDLSSLERDLLAQSARWSRT